MRMVQESHVLQKENKNSQPRLNHAKVIIGGEKRILDQRNGDWRFWFEKAGIIEHIKQNGMLPSHISVPKTIEVGGIKFKKNWQLDIRHQPDLTANIQLKGLHPITVGKIKTDARISTIGASSSSAKPVAATAFPAKLRFCDGCDCKCVIVNQGLSKFC